MVVQYEGTRPEAAPGVAYAPVDLDGQVGVVVDVPLEVYEIVRLFVYLASCLDAILYQKGFTITVRLMCSGRVLY